MFLQGGLSIERMCRLADVGRAGFYRSLERRAKSEDEAELRSVIQEIVLEHHQRYGYRRVSAELRRRGVVANHKRVARVMREDNLLVLGSKGDFSLHSPPDGFEVHLNLAGRLKLSGPNQLWLADITYVRLKLEFVYLAVLLDAFSRRVVGWSLDSTLTTRLPLAALNQAINERQPPRGLVHHSDQGVQYTSGNYREVLRQHGMFASISRPGTPLDNARCESFMRTLKREEIGARSFSSLEEVRRNIEKFIEQYYNVQRLHSALGYRAPVEFETAAGPAVEARGTSAILVI